MNHPHKASTVDNASSRSRPREDFRQGHWHDNSNKPRRQNEISMFSAMVLGDTVNEEIAATNSENEKEREKDSAARRHRQNVLTMFSALATDDNAGGEGELLNDFTGGIAQNEPTHLQNNERNAFLASMPAAGDFAADDDDFTQEIEDDDAVVHRKRNGNFVSRKPGPATVGLEDDTSTIDDDNFVHKKELQQELQQSSFFEDEESLRRRNELSTFVSKSSGDFEIDVENSVSNSNPRLSFNYADKDKLRRKNEISAFTTMAGNDNLKENEKDARRRKNEMSAFAAMATGVGDYESYDGSINMQVNDTDARRRKNEINAFAAMATGSGDYESYGGSINMKDNDMDARRRQNEMSAFSAMATGGDGSEIFDGSFNAKDDDKDSLRRKNEMSAFSAMATGSDDNESFDGSFSAKEDNGTKNEISKSSTFLPGGDQHEDRYNQLPANKFYGSDRRRKETDAFSALASGDVLRSNNNKFTVAIMDHDSFRRDNEKINPETIASDDTKGKKVKTGTSADQQKAFDDKKDASRRQQEIHMFAAMASGSHTVEFKPNSSSSQRSIDNNDEHSSALDLKMGSNVSHQAGTFVNNRKKSDISSNSNQNLAAALASLVESGTPTPSGKEQPVTSHEISGSVAMTRKKPICNQIYSECVLLPRPLFFGNALPTRVIEEASRLCDSLPESQKRSPSASSCSSNRLAGESLISTGGETSKGLSGGLGKGGSNLVVEGDRKSTIVKNDALFGNDINTFPGPPTVQAIYNGTFEDTSTIISPLMSPLVSGNTLKPGSRRQRLNHFKSPSFSSKGSGISVDNDLYVNVPPEYRNFEGAVISYGNGFGRNLFTASTLQGSNRIIAQGGYIASYEPVWGDRARLEKEKIMQKRSSGNIEFMRQPDFEESPGQRKNDDDNPVPETTEILSSHDNGKLNISDTTTADETEAAPTKEQTGHTAEKSRENISESKVADEKSLFSQYARGDTDGYDGTIIGAKDTLRSVPEAKAFSSDTFQAIHNTNEDSGSFEGSELKKQVGLNDNLSKALESLAGGDGDGESAVASLAAAEAAAAAAQAIETWKFTSEDGRPLTNLELTEGRVPLYGCDDTPLPIEADLGMFETKEDQKKSSERRQAQEIIESKAVPHVFGPIICPSRCSGPDDSQSWKSRGGVRRGTGLNGTLNSVTATTPTSDNIDGHQKKSSNQSYHSSSSVESAPPSLGGKSGYLPPPPPPPINTDPSFLRNHRSSAQSVIDSTPGASTTHGSSPSTVSPSTSVSQKQNREHQHQNEKIRIGWWNVLDDFGLKPASNGDLENQSSNSTNSLKHPLQLPPLNNGNPSLDVKTNLKPSPEELQEQNRPLLELHPATSVARHLPYVSDRPPSTRYLQIDTQLVGFPSLGEIEPLFCSIAIWHVEATPSIGSGAKAGTNIAPVPNFNRCGRITESLHFDVVNDEEVKNNCRTALWPTSDALNEGASFKSSAPEHLLPHERLQGTRCGIFPLPSNFDIANLYAVLIVHKVLSEDSEVEVYLKPSKSRVDGKARQSKNVSTDVAKLRSKAAKTSNRLGQFLMPFAFGVAPLVQVIGVEAPSIPASRAVQIPLFKLLPGQGERPIIDHIMVMLYPRGDHTNGAKPADLTKGGTAMLVMRNFGYLGLHSALHSKSKLARDRLVDFTGELQVRRRKEGEKVCTLNDDEGRVTIVPAWHADFVGEPTVNGGRNVVQLKNEELQNVDDKEERNYMSSSYAQEVAPIPLSPTPSGRSSSSKLIGDGSSLGVRGMRGISASPSISNRNKDAEFYFHNSFCNELLCQPRMLHNCTKRNICVKVGVRRLKWCEELNNYIALLPSTGPSIHNTRRGKFLVHDEYTSVAYHTIDPHFLDEFKIKLPLVLGRNSSPDLQDDGRLVILFSAYNISVKGKKWTDTASKAKAMLSKQISKRTSPRNDESSNTGKNDFEENDSFGSTSVTEFLGCGFLHLTLSDDAPCLIPNGLHDVKLKYTTRPAPSAINLQKTSTPSKQFSSGNHDTFLFSNGYDDNESTHGSDQDSCTIGFPPGTLILEPIETRVSDNKTGSNTDLQPFPNSDGLPSYWGNEPKNHAFDESFLNGEDFWKGTGSHIKNNSAEDKSRNHQFSDLISTTHARSSTPTSISSLSATTDSISSRPTKEWDSRIHSIAGFKSRNVIETAVLQVRIAALSSVHPQNLTLARFFILRPKSPRCLTSKELSSQFGPWSLSRSELLNHTNPNRMAQLNFSENSMAEDDKILLQNTIELAKTSLCPAHEIASHFVRIIFQLWRSVVSGNGEPSLLWANPASLIPLRLHSFSSLLYILNSVTIFMSKNGVTQLDGKAKWNMTSMSYVVSMLFDEEALFLGPTGRPLEDPADLNVFIPSPSKRETEDTKDTKFNNESLDKRKNTLHGKINANSKEDSYVGMKPAHSNYSESLRLGLVIPPFSNDSVETNSSASSSQTEEAQYILSASSTNTDDKATLVNNDALKTSFVRTGKTEPENTETLPKGASKDDMNLIHKKGKPQMLESRSVSTPLMKPFKIDTKNDFQSALNAGNSSPDQLAFGRSISPTSSGTGAAMNMINAFGGIGSNSGPAANRRRWMTAPSSALATIQEDNDKVEDTLGENQRDDSGQEKVTKESVSDGNFSDSSRNRDTGDALDTELIVHKSKPTKVKQMRVPFQSLKNDTATDIESKTHAKSQKTVKEEVKGKEKVLPTSDKDIETAGTAFLEVIGKNLGYGVAAKEMGGEEKRVGFAHHRKTRSRCSIDWTLPPTDLLLENHQEMEHLQRQDQHVSSFSDGTIDDVDSDEYSATTATDSEAGGTQDPSDYSERDSSAENKDADQSKWSRAKKISKNPHLFSDQKVHPIKKGNAGDAEIASDKISIKLPCFIDRIALLGKKQKSGRWFPYAYEVVIFQWVALLVEQTKKSEHAPKGVGSSEHTNGRNSEPSPASLKHSPVISKCLSDSASKARGVTIGCAPILFGIIKKSLGWRIDSLFRKRRNDFAAAFPNLDDHLNMPRLVTLDESLLSTLGDLISMLTDACIDSRNFDSWTFRQASFDVNDAIVRFLRDLFAFLEAPVVHRLLMVYFSRYVMKEGKIWQDRDSKIGLRCSWEICKLRLNAITLFVRFADFVKVNSPLMEGWGSWPLSAPSRSTRRFFANAIDQLETFGMSNFSASEGPIRRSAVDIPPLKPHWLVELVTDLCLSATGHAEQNIQHRAASLLHELFWISSRHGKKYGTLSVVASMYVPFIGKILGHISYLSSLPPKSQLRKDLLPCVVFVLQSAPVGLMRAFWRKLCKRAEGKGHKDSFGGIGDINVTTQLDVTLPFGGVTDDKTVSENVENETHLPSILEVFSILNLALKTFEYEGSERNLEDEDGIETTDKGSLWNTDYLLSIEQEGYASSFNRPSPFINQRNEARNCNETEPPRYTTSSSRKWHSHDGAIVIINTSRYIVREALFMLRPSEEESSPGLSADKSTSTIKRESDKIQKQSHNVVASYGDSIDASNSEKKIPQKRHRKSSKKDVSSDELLHFSVADTIIFARATTSVYLHCLSLRQSDIVFNKTLIAAVEVVKVFGIKVFLAAVGETLQHWMRIVLVHCGARRAEVRVQALEFLALMLRLTWDSFGSFFRVRVPLLAVQTEVMERIVATAAARYYREQRRLEAPVQYLTNESAEAALTPLWRTLDRLHHQSASRNVAFKSALQRLAKRMKTLYGAYIAAHALAIVNRTRSTSSPTNNAVKNNTNLPPTFQLNSSHLQINRVISASAGFSKQFLGMKGVSSQQDAVTHSEAVEDAFLAAADVFSSTELPSHRVAWLRKLAEFHSSRGKFAEEATCRFQIHSTLRKAALLNDSLWNSVPFLPWASDSSDGVHLDGDGPACAPGVYYDGDYDLEDFTNDDFDQIDVHSGKHIEKNHSFRRIFYRVANSVRMRTGDWDVGGNKNLFYGVTFASEYNTASPWISLREIEEDMVEEVEIAGELFLKAGIVESSRFAWSVATEFYSGMFNYAKLAYVYRKLALVVASQVPVVDTSNQFELSSPLGRFYRVWFHGGAPDELMGAEFVYRASASVKLEEFGRVLCEVLNSILPDKTPIDLVLDDGRPEDPQKKLNQRRHLGSAPREAIKIKVTPLRPVLRSEKCSRGTAEWFNKQASTLNLSHNTNSSYNGGKTINGTSAGNRDGCITSRNQFVSRSFASDVQSHANRIGSAGSNNNLSGVTGGGELIGVDKFSFTQPIKKDRVRGSRDWLKAPTGDLAEKSLRVTELLVAQSFPACVSRQNVVHRAVFTQSPLEAGVEAVCSWCAVLFRTAVATNGLAVIAGNQIDRGIGTGASKVVADCIYSSGVKEMCRSLLNEIAFVAKEDELNDHPRAPQYEKLSDDEVTKYQVKLARSIVMFMELLHLLIGRNRDMLLTVVQARKRRDASSAGSVSRGGGLRGFPPSPTKTSTHYEGPSSLNDGMHTGRIYDENGANIFHGAASVSSAPDRTDSAMALQSELQRAFISMAKSLHPFISRTIRSETPRWLKLCCQDNYYSSGTYRQTRIAMGEELLFFGGTSHASQQPPPVVERAQKQVPINIPLAIVPTKNASPHGSNAESSTSRNSRTSDSLRFRHKESPSLSTYTGSLPQI